LNIHVLCRRKSNLRIMKTQLLTIIMILCAGLVQAQQPDTITGTYKNTAEQMISSSGKLGIGGYGEVHYNQPLGKNQYQPGTLDVHRMVLFVGYNFSSKTQFVSEVEVEYAKEIWIEQAFLQQKLHKYVNLRAGLLLVPMGIINEYHEPGTFNGVERPVIDNKLALSTWRDIGLGFTGTVLPFSVKYQVYIMGGLNGYDTRAVFSADKGLREGRQKGSKAYVTSPAFSGKIEYFGLRNLNIGLSGYVGKSQSKLFVKLNKDSAELVRDADSSVVGISMVGVDFRYAVKGFEARGQFYYNYLSNTSQYNLFTRSGEKNNDLGRAMIGYYAEVGYNLFRLLPKTRLELIPFVRYEFYNMQQSVEEPVIRNQIYENTMITAGLTFKLNRYAVFKTDFQFYKAAGDPSWSKVMNMGVGVMF